MVREWKLLNTKTAHSKKENGFGNKAGKGISNSLICHDKAFILELRRPKRTQEEALGGKRQFSVIKGKNNVIVGHTLSL